MKTKNKEFIVEGIRNILFTNFGVTYDLIDIEAEVDSTLSFSENLNGIILKYVKPTALEAHQ